MATHNTPPILFLVFNRPEETKRVLEVIRQYAPQEIYLAADGPREGNSNDATNCTKVKEVLSTIDWPCKVHTLFRDKNLGCKVAVSSAITWFFEQVEYGIILEDDILPDPSFFTFCAKLLELYKDDERIMHITGFNVAEKWKYKSQEFHGSRFGGIWGWASWKRAWKHYDVTIKFWENKALQETILNTYFPENMREGRRKLYDDLYDGLINTWDYQWTLCRLKQDGVCLVPALNLIKNIGFNELSTHLTVAPAWSLIDRYNLNTAHLEFRNIDVDQEYDQYHLNLTSAPKKEALLAKGKNFLNKVINGLRKI